MGHFSCTEFKDVGRASKTRPAQGNFQPKQTKMGDEASVQKVSDDETKQESEVQLEETVAKKRKATGAAAHMCLKRIEGKRVQ